MGGARVKNGHGDGVGSELQAALAAVREGLAELHRRLLEPVRRAYEATHERIAGPGELLQLLTQHAHFAWLRQLSELLADLDALADEPPTQELGAAVRAASEALVMAPRDAGEPGEFWKNYSPLLQDAEVAVAHGQLRKLLAALPDANKAGARTLRERHRAALAKKRR